jgi:hypothetical protein
VLLHLKYLPLALAVSDIFSRATVRGTKFFPSDHKRKSVSSVGGVVGTNVGGCKHEAARSVLRRQECMKFSGLIRDLG